MTFKRLYHTFRLCIIRGGTKRAEYLRRKRVFAGVGENVMIQSRRIPLYANLIRFHNNIQIASNVSFITHDVTHAMLNRIDEREVDVQEVIGCIEVMDNVFIGANSTVLYNTRIGPNVIVAANSVVTKDVPPGCVVGGVPAHVIGKFDDYILKREREVRYPSELKLQKESVCLELAKWVWDNFEKQREGSAEEKSKENRL